jgi:hypothetical protein
MQLIALGVEEIITKTVAHRLCPLALRSLTTTSGQPGPYQAASQDGPGRAL